MSLRGGGEIPKGGRAGRARSLGIWPRGGEIPRDLAPGGRDHGGTKSMRHRDTVNMYTENLTKLCRSSNWNHHTCCIPTEAWPITTSDILFAITRFVLYTMHIPINLRHKKNITKFQHGQNNISNSYEKSFTKQINQWSAISNYYKII